MGGGQRAFLGTRGGAQSLTSAQSRPGGQLINLLQKTPRMRSWTWALGQEVGGGKRREVSE